MSVQLWETLLLLYYIFYLGSAQFEFPSYPTNSLDYTLLPVEVNNIILIIYMCLLLYDYYSDLLEYHGFLVSYGMTRLFYC